jgi:hypothetical protein
MFHDITRIGFEFPDKPELVHSKMPAATEEFVRLHTAALHDKSALVILSAESVQSVVQFCQDSSVRLQSSKTKVQSIGTGPNRTEMPAVLSLGVCDQTGEMTVAIEQNDILKIDLQDDPFTALIIDFFRRQYDASAA